MADVKISRFMIVDEQDANLLFFEMLLKAIGYNDVITAKTGAEAALLVEQKAPQFVLVAWELGSMPGTVFVQKIRAARKRRHLPFIIYSKRMSEQDAALLKELGIDNVLTMPFDKQKATELVTRLVKEEENLDPILRTMRRVEDLLDERKPTDALSRMNARMLTAGPHAHLAQTLLAEVWIALQRLDKAEEAVTAALAAKATHVPALRLSAKLKSLRGQHGEALAILEKLAEASPKNLTTKLSLGSAYVKADRHTDAKKVFAEVSLLDEDNTQLKDEKGQLALKEGDVSLAAQLLSQTANGDEIAAYFNNLGIAYAAKNELSKAIETYRSAMQVLSSRARLHVLQYNLGLALRRDGKTEEALRAFAASYTLDFRFEKAYAAYVKLYKEHPGTAAAKATAAEVKAARAKFTAMKAKEAAA